MKSERQLAEELAALHPDLSRLLTDAQPPSAAPFLFLQLVADWAVKELRSGRVDDVRRVISSLETSFAYGDRYVRDLVAVGFVEALPASSEAGGREIASLLGPQLTSEYRRLKW